MKPFGKPGATPGAGLCPTCIHVKLVQSGKGSVFLLCTRAKVDPAFPKYPPQPVLACPGFAE